MHKKSDCTQESQIKTSKTDWGHTAKWIDLEKLQYRAHFASAWPAPFSSSPSKIDFGQVERQTRAELHW